MVTNVASLLHNVPIFSDCSPKDLAAVARGMKEVNHKAGTVIAREGEPGVGLFVIVEGEAKVTIGDKPRRTLGPGEFFGEIALLDGGPRTATVTAETDIKAHVLVAWDFRPLVKDDPDLAWGLLRGVAGMLRTREGY